MSLSEGFIEWLGYYKNMDEEEFHKLTLEKRKHFIESYHSDVDFGWLDVKDDLIKMKKTKRSETIK